MKISFKRYTQTKRLGKALFVFGFLSLLLSGMLAFSVFNSGGLQAAPAPGADSNKTVSKQTPASTPVSDTAVPSSFADLAAKLSPTVVNIKATKIEKTRAHHMPNIPGEPFGDFFGRFFREMPQFPDTFPRQGAGSGVIISDDGYILTNNHVVEGAKDLSVTLNNKNEYTAKIVGRDPKTDLAVLKIDVDEKLPTAVMGDSDVLRVGDWVLAIGNPFGLSHTVTSGIVSAKGRVIGAGPYDDFIQTDASINPGNSGGPLFNMEGKLVGINTAIIAQGQGIGFAIPVNTASPLIPQLVNKGKVTRGYLGVNIQNITPDLAKALKIKERKGALVADVIPGSPADKAGIKRGDVILAYNNKQVEDSHDLPPIVAATPEGESATVTLARNGKKKDVAVKIGELSSAEGSSESPGHTAQGKWGLMLEDFDSRSTRGSDRTVDHGVLIGGVQPGSPADLAGLRRGDIILEVNQTPVNSVNDVKKRIAGANGEDSLLLLVKRDEGSFFVGLSG